MILNTILLVIGFYLLIKSADIFVENASDAAIHFKIPKILIGLTVVSIGTSAPEFAVSMQSLMNGSGDIVLGNVVGSNIINTLLIIGVAATIRPIRIKSSTLKKELPFYILISLLTFILFFDSIFDQELLNILTKSDGTIITLMFVIFGFYLFKIMQNKHETKETTENSLIKSIVLLIVSVLVIMISAELIVFSATEIANELNVSQRIISLTIIAFGTTLPELVTSFTALKKGEIDILVGNVIGSNIFNICIVLGIPVMLLGPIQPDSFPMIDFIVMLLSSIILFIFSYKEHKVTKSTGIIMIILFIVYYSYILFI